jgi:GR25 family glycosyltransferase involved in LPS biosynthesis
VIAKSFVINLDRQMDKYERFLKRNAGCGMTFNRVSASEGAKMSDGEVAASGLVTPGSRFTKGALGNAASHRKIWQWVVEQNMAALVFEDDATVRHDAQEKLATLTLPENWDYLAIGYNTDAVLDVGFASGMRAMMRFSPQFPSDETDAAFQQSKAPVAVFRLNTCFGTAGYVVSPTGAKKLLQLVFPLDNRLFDVPGFGRYVRNGNGLSVEAADCRMAMIFNAIEAYACFAPLVLPRNDKVSSTVVTDDAHVWEAKSST